MNLFRNFKKIACITLLIASQDANSGLGSFIDGISTALDKQLSENGIKPYIIPMDQGRLINHEGFIKVDVGLSKER